MRTSKMRRNWIGHGVKIALLVVLAVAVVSFVVMSLWNWLMPALFGSQLISFWQALGLLVLSRILFGGFRGRPGYGMHWRRRMAERWEQMSPEEREKFREGMRGRCGHFGPTATEPKV
jgi:hypothetical protein